MCSCLCFNRHVSGCCNTVNLPTVEQMKVFLFRFLLQSCQRIACLGNNEELGGWLCGFIIPQVWAIAPKHKPPLIISQQNPSALYRLIRQMWILTTSQNGKTIIRNLQNRNDVSGATFDLQIGRWTVGRNRSLDYRWRSSLELKDRRDIVAFTHRSSDLLGCSWFPGNLRPGITSIFCSKECVVGRAALYQWWWDVKNHSASMRCFLCKHADLLLWGHLLLDSLFMLS